MAKDPKRTTYRTMGDLAILDRPQVAILCSAKCPGKLILDTYELAKRFREKGVTVISGFHSPVEEECLRILLRGTTPVVWCLARGTLARVPPTYRPAAKNGLLKIVAPFSDHVRRVTATTCAKRNRIVADMADAVFVVHAAPGSKIEDLSHSLLAAGKPLFTFDHPTNAALIAAGAHPITPDSDWTAITGTATLRTPKGTP